MGELLLVSSPDRQDALIWSYDEQKLSYQEIVDRVRIGDIVVCLNETVEVRYVFVMSPRGRKGYIHQSHVSTINE